jgi:hypothetical protein
VWCAARIILKAPQERRDVGTGIEQKYSPPKTP